MPSPVNEKEDVSYGSASHSVEDFGPARGGSLPTHFMNEHRIRNYNHDNPSEDGTVVADHLNEKDNLVQPSGEQRPRSRSHVTIQSEYEHGHPLRNMSSAQSRERRRRLDDDLEMLKVERQVSRQVDDHLRAPSGSFERDRSRLRPEHVDEFDIATNPVHEQTQAYTPVEHPSTRFGKFVKSVHKSNWLIRYVTYITPPTMILLIPLLLGALVYKKATVGGVHLLWFMIWLEIVWLTLWAGRILAKCLPWPIGLVSSLFTNNDKKWRDMGKQLELPATLFFWWLAIEVSFLPTMTYHQKGYPHGHVQSWMNTMNKVLVSIFVGVILNFVAKIIIQLIAISFHLRTYADRIEINKFQIGSLTKLYKFSKGRINMDDAEFEDHADLPSSGARTPGYIVSEAAKRTKVGFNKFGDVAGKIAGDFTGRQTTKSTHPSQVVLALLSSTNGAQILARRLYRTFAREESETVVSEDLQNAFDNEDEAEAAFTMFDKDLNGDISMEELEAVCVEIGRERKSITASLKDLDSVVGKLDDMFMFVVFVITVLVFLSLISTSAAGVLASAGSAVLALSWLLSATAQEFLQSCIFVFVKHPFDVGDRVTIYGNTGSALRGDDYFVKEISLLYTEFKKMEGHIVQAPNSYLNTLFILNQRRSGGLAEAVSITIKFGTTLDQIEGLRNKLLDFVTAEKREYQSNILTELRDIVDVHSMNLNIIFFYKSNWQNEGLRLARRNKFICALMVSMQEMGIEGPMHRLPGQRQSYPIYLQNVPHVRVPGVGHSGHANAPGGLVPDIREPGADEDLPPPDPPFVSPIFEGEEPPEDLQDQQPPYTNPTRNGSILHRGGTGSRSRTRAESLSQMNRRVDFSLGAKDAAIADLAGDVYESRSRSRVPIELTEASRAQQLEVQAGHRDSAADVGSSTSRDDQQRRSGSRSRGLFRRSTDSGTRWRNGSVGGSGVAGGSIHQNRFFGRSVRRLSHQGGGAQMDDPHVLESGMADIPESPPSTVQPRPDRIDPRTGLVSPQAMTPTTPSAR